MKTYLVISTEEPRVFDALYIEADSMAEALEEVKKLLSEEEQESMELEEL